MLNAYERRLVAFYLSNAADRLHHLDPEATELADWLERGDDRLVFPERSRRRRDWQVGSDERLTAGRWRKIQETLRGKHAALKKVRPDLAAQRLRRLGNAVGLSRTDVDILELLLRDQAQPILERLISDIFSRSRLSGALNLRGPAMPTLLGKTPHTVQSRFGADKPLLRSGLVSVDRDGDPEVTRRLHRLATVPSTDCRNVNRLLLDAAPESDLEWRDFRSRGP